MTNARRSPLRALTAATLSLSMVFGNVAPARAANHPNSSVRNVNVLNLTANVDWDYDAETPATQLNNPGQALNKAYITSVLRETARTMYLMTDGRHRVGTIYVYKSGRFADNVDIRMLNVAGRSNATPAGWNGATGTSSNFLASGDGTAQTVREVATVIAHELGHYVYGLYDEYRESGRALDAAQPTAPADTDWAKTTLMHTQAKYTRLSVPADYEAGKLAENQTAQARMYATNRADFTGGSAWETLVRDPKDDPNPATRQRRTHFEAFKGIPVPQTTAGLSKYVKVLCHRPGYYLGYDCYNPSPSNGFVNMQRAPQSDIVTDLGAFTALTHAASGGTATQDAADGQAGSAFEDFKVVFADTPAVPNTGGAARAALTRTMLMIDNSMSTNNIGEVVKIAQGLVNTSSATDQMGIALADGTSPLLSPLVTTDAAGKTALLQALAAYTPAQGTLNLTTAYNAVSTTLQGAPSIDGDGNQVTFLTYPNTAVAASLAQDARNKRIPINVVTLHTFYTETNRNSIVSTGGAGVDRIGVEALSARSGGSAVSGKSVEEAISRQAVETKQAQGENIGEILYTDVNFAGARRESTPFVVTASDKGEVTASWHFDPADRSKLSFKLVSPTGADVWTLDKDSDLADGYAAITVDNADGSKTGAWQAVTTSSARTADDVALSITTESDVHLGAQVSGPDRGLAPMLTAEFKGALPISNAIVRADVFDVKTNTRVKSGLLLRDDGRSPDLRANDGVYTLDLTDALGAGDYEFEVTATTNATSLFESANVIFAREECGGDSNCDASLSTGAAATLVGGGLMRTEVAALSLAADSPGVVGRVVASAGSADPSNPSSTSSSGNDDDRRGGGCTVGGRDHADIGLLMLLTMALAGLAISRRRRC